jgi:hypothetical protein
MVSLDRALEAGMVQIFSMMEDAMVKDTRIRRTGMEMAMTGLTRRHTIRGLDMADHLTADRLMKRMIEPLLSL